MNRAVNHRKYQHRLHAAYEDDHPARGNRQWPSESPSSRLTPAGGFMSKRSKPWPLPFKPHTVVHLDKQLHGSMRHLAFLFSLIVGRHTWLSLGISGPLYREYNTDYAACGPRHHAIVIGLKDKNLVVYSDALPMWRGND